MSSNVGLSTPRGSGTSGYVQRNLSLLKPRAAGAGQPYPSPRDTAPRVRKPDQQILQHDRLREIEVQVMARREELEDAGELGEEEIEEACEEERTRLVREMENGKGGGSGVKGRKLKGYQVHELAEAKERESERLRRALGLKKGMGGGGAEEDGEHPMARQERRKREVEEKRERERDGEELKRREAEDER